MRRSSPIQRRLDAAEAEIAMRFREHAMDALAGAINASPPGMSRAIEMRLRSLWARQSKDPAWNDSDPIDTILHACADVAPNLVASVVAELGIELTPNTGRPNEPENRKKQ